jgi:hypothetical protein
MITLNRVVDLTSASRIYGDLALLLFPPEDFTLNSPSSQGFSARRFALARSFMVKLGLR